MYPPYWNKAKRHLSKQCPTMKQLIARYKGEGLRARGNGFYTLLRSVVGQQISVKAADAVWAKVEKTVKPLTPKKLLAMPDEKLRACGLSASKVAYAKNVAKFYERHRLVPDGGVEGVIPSPLRGGLGRGAASEAELHHAPHPNPPRRGEGGPLRLAPAKKSTAEFVIESDFWAARSDDEVIAELTAIKGIGTWTAEMFLIFHLMRPDVFPVKDLGVLKALHQHVPGIKAPPKEKWLKPTEYQHIAARWAPYRTVATWYLWRALDPVAVEY